MQRQQIAFRIPELYAAVLVGRLLGYVVNVGLAPPSGGSSSGAASERAGSPMIARGGLLVLGSSCSSPRSRLWEVWARAEALVPRPAAERGRRAALGRLADARRSSATSRRASGGSPSASCIGAGVGRRRRARCSARRAARGGRSSRSSSSLRAMPPIAVVPGRDRRPRLRRRDARSRDRLRRVLPRPRQHRRGRPRGPARGARHRVDAAGRAGASGSTASTCPPRSRRSPPGSASRSRSGSSLVVISEFAARATASATTSAPVQREFDVPEMYGGLLFLGPARLRR